MGAYPMGAAPPMMTGGGYPPGQQQYPHQQQLAPHQQPGQAGGPSPPTMSPEDEQAFRRLQERQQMTSTGFQLLGQALQLGAMLASSGHQILSVVVGTTFALRTGRALFGGGGSFPQGMANGGMDLNNPGFSPTMPASPLAAKEAARGPAATGLRGLIQRLSSSPAAVIALVAVVVFLEHVWRSVRARRERERLMAEEAALGIAADVDAEEQRLAASTSMLGGRALTIAPSLSASVAEPPASVNVAASGNVFVARHDFTAEASNQLSLRAGDQLRIDEHTADGWCWGTLTAVQPGGGQVAVASRSGFVPGNYVERVVAARRRL